MSVIYKVAISKQYVVPYTYYFRLEDHVPCCVQDLPTVVLPVIC